ncbi:hypothetical protein [Methylophaga sp. OBS4]|uniref:hypothetical protein n=1 Tax=Methylophaga sp. OBS4 TaxID=2991935 RepID=UPI00224E3DD6|nr:hypothetical protein [Methylophaga sp. OBS4]MCX4186882.1 hypothetical protein [Methylophaga sp. OBS4]
MILKVLVTSLVFLSNSSLLSLAISLAILFGLFIIICWTFQIDKQASFEEQSKIPVNDDTPAEKQLFAQERHRSAGFKRFDA